MILKWGDATANKISLGDCEAKRNGAGLNQTMRDRRCSPARRAALLEIYNRHPVSRRILRRLFFGPFSDEWKFEPLTTVGLVHQPPRSAEGEQAEHRERHPVQRFGQDPQSEAQ